MALCTVGDVESIIQLDYSTALKNDITNVYIPYAESAIKRFLGYDPEYDSSITEKFDGKERTHLFLKVAPVVSITSVTEDDVALTSGNDKDYVALSKIENFNNDNAKTIFIPNEEIARGDIILNCDGMHYSEKTIKKNSIK